MDANRVTLSRTYMQQYVSDLSSNSTLIRLCRMWLVVKFCKDDIYSDIYGGTYGYTLDESNTDKSLKLVPSEKKLRDMISISPDESSYFLFKISVTAEDEQLAKDINDALYELITTSEDETLSTFQNTPPYYSYLRAALLGIRSIEEFVDEQSYSALLKENDIRLGVSQSLQEFSDNTKKVSNRLAIRAIDLGELSKDVEYDASFIPGSTINVHDKALKSIENELTSTYTLIGIAAGLVLSYGLFFLKHLLEGKLRKEEDVINVSTLPVLASIPDIKI